MIKKATLIFLLLCTYSYSFSSEDTRVVGFLDQERSDAHFRAQQAARAQQQAERERDSRLHNEFVHGLVHNLGKECVDHALQNPSLLEQAGVHLQGKKLHLKLQLLLEVYQDLKEKRMPLILALLKDLQAKEEIKQTEEEWAEDDTDDTDDTGENQTEPDQEALLKNVLLEAAATQEAFEIKPLDDQEAKKHSEIFNSLTKYLYTVQRNF